MSESDDRYQRITLRIPKELHALLQAAADRLSRSMNAEVIARLEASFSSVEERLAALEALVFHDEFGNVAAWHSASRDISRLEELIEALAERGRPYR